MTIYALCLFATVLKLAGDAKAPSAEKVGFKAEGLRAFEGQTTGQNTTVESDSRGAPASPPDPGWTRLNGTAFVATGVAVLLLGTAGFFAAEAASDADDINRLIRSRNVQDGAPLGYGAVADQYERAMADGSRHDRYAKAALIGASGAAVVATVLFVLDAKLTREPALTIGPTERGVGAGGGWGWRF